MVRLKDCVDVKHIKQTNIGIAERKALLSCNQWKGKVIPFLSRALTKMESHNLKMIDKDVN